jgi:hypothetical protein
MMNRESYRHTRWRRRRGGIGMTTTSTSVRRIALPPASRGKRKQRASMATATNPVDDPTLVDGPATHQTPPAPFPRVDTER